MKRCPLKFIGGAVACLAMLVSSGDTLAELRSPYGSIVGRILDERGDPLAGLRVAQSRTGPDERGRVTYRKVRSTRADVHGKFRFEHAIPGEYTLLIGGQTRGWIVLPVKVEAGKESRVELGERVPLSAAENTPAGCRVSL